MLPDVVGRYNVDRGTYLTTFSCWACIAKAFAVDISGLSPRVPARPTLAPHARPPSARTPLFLFSMPTYSDSTLFKTVLRRRLASSRSHLHPVLSLFLPILRPRGRFSLSSPTYAPARAADAVLPDPVFSRKLVYNAFYPFDNVHIALCVCMHLMRSV